MEASSEEVNDWILAEDYRFGGKTRSRLSSKPGLRVLQLFRLWIHRYRGSRDLRTRMRDFRSKVLEYCVWGLEVWFLGVRILSRTTS